ncbi:MAG TPA: bacterio-opsin activator, partial [Candidatus Aenigmarchaeota archaeon]|nr:bacterio-opsin activator [Candidatus Aenigmarchaeota archaeon]
MVIEVKPIIQDIERKVLKTFMKSIEVLGGPKKLIEHRHLTWLPALMEACYIVILKEEYKKTVEEIAKELGITDQT